MIELIQFPWSPFCLVQRRILEFAGVRFKLTSIPSNDRSLVWKCTRGRYYSVPVLRQEKVVVFEVEEASQVIAKYLDSELQLGLFPWRLEGLQSLLWRHIETEIEDCCFRLNDIYWREHVPAAEQLDFLRFKERKFGRGCLEQWQTQQPELLARLELRLQPFEEMLLGKDFLLEERPRFVDFDLYGMLAAFLYSGHYQLPARHGWLQGWFDRMTHLKLKSFACEEKLHS